MLNQGFNIYRWKHGTKVGQALSATIIARVNGGYKIEVEEPFCLTGYLPTQRQLCVGQGVLVRLAGHANKIPLFNTIYC